MRWLQIETAPKDGTFVLICMPSGHRTIAQWCTDSFWRSHVNQESWEAWTPKWWMPIPEAPK